MAKITNIDTFNCEIEKAVSPADSGEVFDATPMDILQEYVRVSNEADNFNLLTMRGEYLLNQARQVGVRRETLEEAAV